MEKEKEEKEKWDKFVDFVYAMFILTIGLLFAGAVSYYFFEWVGVIAIAVILTLEIVLLTIYFKEKKFG